MTLDSASALKELGKLFNLVAETDVNFIVDSTLAFIAQKMNQSEVGIEAMADLFDKMLTHLVGAINDKQYICGDYITIADFCCATLYLDVQQTKDD